MKNDLSKKVWGWVSTKLPIGYAVDIGFYDHQDYDFYECMNKLNTYVTRDAFYLVKLDGCNIVEIYSFKEANRMLKLDKL